MNMNPEGNLWEELPVTDDFKVYLNLESLPYFDMMRSQLLEEKSKRGSLYKFHNHHGLVPSQNYMPRDVAEAIVKSDLVSLYEKGKQALDQIASLRHPNLAIGLKKR